MAATAIRPSASPSKSSRPWKARRTACCFPAAWRRSRPRCTRCCRITPTSSSPTILTGARGSFLTQTLHRYGIEVSVVPAGDYQAIEEAIRPTTRLLGQRIADQSLQSHRRHGALCRYRQAPSGENFDRRDLCHAVQPAAAGVRHRSGAPLGDQISGRPQRSARRRGARRRGVGRRHSLAATCHRRDYRSAWRRICWCAA